MQRLLEGRYTIQDGSILIFRDFRWFIDRELQNGCLFKLGDPSENHIDALIQRSNRLMKLSRIGVQKRSVMEQFRKFSQSGAINIFILKAQIRADAINDFLLIGLVIVQRKAEIIQAHLSKAL